MNTRARIGSFLAVVLLVQLAAGPAAAALLQVPEDHATIAAALAAASYGDTVSIAAGTYNEHDLVWPPGVSILGRASNPDWVVLDAQYQGRVMGGEDLVPENELAFLTLRGGHEPGLYGSGLMVVGDPYLHDLVIEECISTTVIYGIGLYVQGGATIVDCIFRHNHSSAPGTLGGGAFIMGGGWGHQPYVRNLELHDNEAAGTAGMTIIGKWGVFDGLYVHDNLGSGVSIVNGEVDGIGPTILNSLFENNEGCGLGFDAGAVIQNCTIVGNTLTLPWVGALQCSSTWDHPMDPLVTGCIVAFNKGGGIGRYDMTPLTIECCDVYGNTGGNYVGALGDQTGLNGNISLDPLFCPPGGSIPYGVQSKSPCAPQNNGCAVLMGAFPVQCPGTSTQATSWSAVKALY